MINGNKKSLSNEYSANSLEEAHEGWIETADEAASNR